MNVQFGVGSLRSLDALYFCGMKLPAARWWSGAATLGEEKLKKMIFALPFRRHVYRLSVWDKIYEEDVDRLRDYGLSRFEVDEVLRRKFIDMLHLIPGVLLVSSVLTWLLVAMSDVQCIPGSCNITSRHLQGIGVAIGVIILGLVVFHLSDRKEVAPYRLMRHLVKCFSHLEATQREPESHGIISQVERVRDLTRARYTARSTLRQKSRLITLWWARVNGQRDVKTWDRGVLLERHLAWVLEDFDDEERRKHGLRTMVISIRHSVGESMHCPPDLPEVPSGVLPEMPLTWTRRSKFKVAIQNSLWATLIGLVAALVSLALKFL
ncbi:hypothetical protein [Amycolatopsis sp. H20-H5]|uniref:hypothetical protein n=1 Tax=Amycolatopsis sp. H20-H5 TaxID=3046309 RepID=UPI002DBEC770|nr:hypothetical protein [Amycolatopsis sp. H20-H5]MEC3979663.1 hypothetical protein [Amycolatopsis sp. H20-H5]